MCRKRWIYIVIFLGVTKRFLGVTFITVSPWTVTPKTNLTYFLNNERIDRSLDVTNMLFLYWHMHFKSIFALKKDWSCASFLGKCTPGTLIFITALILLTYLAFLLTFISFFLRRLLCNLTGCCSKGETIIFVKYAKKDNSNAIK